MEGAVLSLGIETLKPCADVPVFHCSGRKWERVSIPLFWTEVLARTRPVSLVIPVLLVILVNLVNLVKLGDASSSFSS